ncbi:MAG: hypothetical protein HUU15_00130 [Candidatus Brocadiae bacterium]|nr:hypothetical protein [Candidatus Brocadiia bacterium]
MSALPLNRDIVVAWNWEHDVELVADLEAACCGLGLTFGSVTPETVDELLAAASSGGVRWGVLLDRAWESDARFRRLNDLVAASGTRLANPPERSLRMGNKATLHPLLQAAGVPVPRAIDVLPAEWSVERIQAEAASWRRPLWLKPANSGGGDGVTALAEIPDRFPLGPEWAAERCVLQEDATPMTLGGTPAWFRVFLVFGTPHIFWWHPGTHLFRCVAEGECAREDLACVADTAAAVAALAGMEIFSCEIALVAPERPLVIDPVNDPVDLRRRSRAADGIPDAPLAEMIRATARGLAGLLGAPPRSG